jgi:uncharacterized ferritin-like protein (DUF455 family)
MPVHNLLWRECAKSSTDVSARMAVIPLVQVLNHYSLCDAYPKYIRRYFVVDYFHCSFFTK